VIKLPPWHAHPDVWLLFGSILAAYLIAGRRHLRETGEVTPRRTKRFFVLGVAVLWLGADWPIHDLAERYLYSAHMVQHMLFTLVARRC
jgi:putative membrane protein